MSSTNCPNCRHKLTYAGNRRWACKHCEQEFQDTSPERYKVVTQRDEFFGGQFDPEKLALLLNTLAEEGWRVVSMATADVSTFFGTFWAGRGAREEIIVLLEREPK